MTDEILEAIFDEVARTAADVRAELPGARSPRAGTNPSGERRFAADARADELFADRLTSLDGVGAYASEERSAVLECGDGYSLAVDPLDGSSNLTSNNPVGTIVGVYDAHLPAPGRRLRGACYVLYGPVTTMTAAAGGTVETYAIHDGDRRLLEGDVTIPEKPTVYGFGGRTPEWPSAFESFSRTVETELKCRYGGALVADVHQVLSHGGIFAYPGLVSRPEGKLRTLFEGSPMAYVVEAAGGGSSDGSGSLLDVEPDGLHDRVPVHVGNGSLIERLETSLTEVRA